MANDKERECAAAYSRAYYHQNKERIRVQRKLRGQRPEWTYASKLRAYGLTVEDYEAIFEKQGGLCAICHRKKSLVIDHCHVGRFVRGLLCVRCNNGLGQFVDSPQFLQNAIEYLTRV